MLFLEYKFGIEAVLLQHIRPRLPPVLYMLRPEACCEVTRLTAFLSEHILEGFKSFPVSVTQNHGGFAFYYSWCIYMSSKSMIEIVCNCLEMDISYSAATWTYTLRVDFKYYFCWDQAAAVHFKVNVFSQHGSHIINLYIWVDLTRSQNFLANHLPCERLMMLFNYSN